MGGGVIPTYPFPKYVWSPSGGWWNWAPPAWKRNTVIAFGVIIATSVPVFMFSAANERRAIPNRPIPSQRWSKHTLDDDPDYEQKVADYKANKKSLLKRLLP